MAAAYRLTATNEMVIRTADNSHIPRQPLNTDWATYQAWLAAGGVPDPPVVIPKSKQQEAIDWIAGGLTINFQGQPQISVTYRADRPYTHNYNSIDTRIGSGDGLPNNDAAVYIPDYNGVPRSITKAQLSKFIKAITDFVHNSNLYVMGVNSALPINNTAVLLAKDDLPTPMYEKLFEYENRLLKLEGKNPISTTDFMERFEHARKIRSDAR